MVVICATYKLLNRLDLNLFIFDLKLNLYDKSAVYICDSIYV